MKHKLKKYGLKYIDIKFYKNKDKNNYKLVNNLNKGTGKSFKKINYKKPPTEIEEEPHKYQNESLTLNKTQFNTKIKNRAKSNKNSLNNNYSNNKSFLNSNDDVFTTYNNHLNVHYNKEYISDNEGNTTYNILNDNKSKNNKVFKDHIKYPKDKNKGLENLNKNNKLEIDNKKSNLRGLDNYGKRLVEKEILDSSINEQEDFIGDITRKKVQKHTYKTSKSAYKVSKSIGKNVKNSYIKYRNYKELKESTNSIILPSKSSFIKNELKNTVKTSAISLAAIIKNDAIEAIEDFKGSDDIGMQAIVKPKNALFKIRRVIKGINTFKITPKVSKTTFNSLNKKSTPTKILINHTKNFFSNPVIFKGLASLFLLVVVFLIFISIVSTITTIFSTLSLKSEDIELSKTYLYITKLDTELEKNIKSNNDDKTTYYLNGQQVSKEHMKVYTNADLLLAYLDSKYQDFKFSSLVDEVESIHKSLHKVDISTNINLTTKSWEDYYEENKDTLLNESQKQQYESLKEVGVYTFRKVLGSPFIGVNWINNVSSRWGWRIHPIDGDVRKHLGLDISMDYGTPINACNDGIVYVNSLPNSYGNYIKVTDDNKDYTLYAHLSSFNVTNGQKVKKGEVIGYVGSTGNSTGNHLHLEYHKKGNNLNPLIFAEIDE